MKNRIICFLCVFAIAVTLSGCDKIVLQPDFNQEAQTDKPREKIIAENNDFSLEWNSSMGVTLKSVSTGEVWGTTPIDSNTEQVDELGMPVKKHPHVESVLIVDYIDAETNTEKTLVSYSGAVRDGRVNCQTIDNGLRVEFYFDTAQFMMRSGTYDRTSAMLWVYFLISGAVMGIIVFLYNRILMKRWEA